MQSRAIKKIRSAGFSKINSLVRAARFYKELRPAFAEWVAGDIYVCKKNGTYRYRFGKRGKSATRWSARAQSVFTSQAAFAFAAVVLGGTLRSAITLAEKIEKEQTATPSASARVNVIQLAKAA